MFTKLIITKIRERKKKYKQKTIEESKNYKMRCLLFFFFFLLTIIEVRMLKSDFQNNYFEECYFVDRDKAGKVSQI